VLRDAYINTELAEEMIDMLEGNLQRGEYDEITDSKEFSAAVMEDVYKLQAPSRHRMPQVNIGFWEPFPIPEKEGKGGVKMEKFEFDEAEQMEQLRRMNFGFGEIERVEVGNSQGKMKTIKTLPIRTMVHMGGHPDMDKELQKKHTAEIEAGISEIMESVVDADALIIDLRYNPGGDPHTAAFIITFFLDSDDNEKTIHLFDLIDKSGGVNRSYSTTPQRAGTKKFGNEKGLFVLTSGSTMSVAENMVYTLRALGRIDAVIGEDETTAGVAVAWDGPRYIAEETFGKGWWRVMVPSLKPVSAITMGNWEGEGVKSDVWARGDHGWGKTADVKEIGRRIARRRFDVEWMMEETKLQSLEAKELTNTTLGDKRLV